jgi:hypothetical protein
MPAGLGGDLSRVLLLGATEGKLLQEGNKMPTILRTAEAE